MRTRVLVEAISEQLSPTSESSRQEHSNVRIEPPRGRARLSRDARDRARDSASNHSIDSRFDSLLVSTGRFPAPDLDLVAVPTDEAQCAWLSFRHSPSSQSPDTSDHPRLKHHYGILHGIVGRCQETPVRRRDASRSRSDRASSRSRGTRTARRARTASRAATAYIHTQSLHLERESAAPVYESPSKRCVQFGTMDGVLKSHWTRTSSRSSHPSFGPRPTSRIPTKRLGSRFASRILKAISTRIVSTVSTHVNGSCGRALTDLTRTRTSLAFFSKASFSQRPVSPRAGGREFLFSKRTRKSMTRKELAKLPRRCGSSTSS